MAVVSRVAKLTLSSAGGTRTWTATAAAQDTAAGQAVAVTITESSTGTPATAPAPHATCTLGIKRADGTVVAFFGHGPFTGSSVTSTVWMTDTALAAGSPRTGTLLLDLRVENTTTGVAYNYETDGNPSTLPAGVTATLVDRGFVRATTTATTTLNAAAHQVPQNVTAPAAGERITATTTLGAQPYLARTVAVALTGIAAVASSSSATTTFTTALGVADNRFTAAAAVRSTTTTFPNDAVTGAPWTAATLVEASSTVDPRITFTHLLQENDPNYGAPPASKHRTKRFLSRIGFLDSRPCNAAGQGIVGLARDEKLYDGVVFTAAAPQKTRSVVSATGGGEAGWTGALLVWDGNPLPTGQWTYRRTVTAAGYAGLETNGDQAVVLAAANPDLRIICAAGPATAPLDARHFSPGVPLLVGLAVVDTASRRKVTLDTNPAPGVMLGRFNIAQGRAEYLAADGVTWTPTYAAGTEQDIHFHACAPSPVDPNVWTAAFLDTTAWGVSDVFVIGRAYVDGAPVNDFHKEIAVNGINNHDVRDTLAAGLSDVDVVGAQPGQALVFDGTTWTAGDAGVTPQDIAAIKDAVWDEPAAAARAAGSFGELVRDRVDVAVSTRATPTDLASTGTTHGEVS